MEKKYLNIRELSEYLNMKQSTLYAMVANGKLPHYRVGRLIRFKKERMDIWMEGNRREPVDPGLRARVIVRKTRGPATDISSVIKKAVDGRRGKSYTPTQGKPDRIKGLGKEV